MERSTSYGGVIDWGSGVKSLAADLGWELEVGAWVDSTAAKSIGSRVGLGKVRHMEVRFFVVAGGGEEEDGAVAENQGPRESGGRLD